MNSLLLFYILFFTAILLGLTSQFTTYDKNIIYISGYKVTNKSDFRLKSCNNTSCIKFSNNSFSIIKEDKPYLFIHIPKNAGTYLRHIFPGMNGKDDHMTMQFISEELPILKMNCFSFAVIRNPYERCVSMYNNTINTKVMDIKGWGLYAQEIFKENDITSFADFVDFLYKRRNSNSFGEIVWQRQSHFICDKNGTIIVDKLIKMENLDSSVDDLIQRFQITHKKPDKKINVSNTCEWKSYYTKELKNKVREIYMKDFEITGYAY